MGFIIDLGQIVLITIPIYIVIRVIFIIFHKKMPWMSKLHRKIKNSKKEKVIPFTILLLSGLLCSFLINIFSFNNLQVGLALGLFLGITNIFDTKILK